MARYKRIKSTLVQGDTLNAPDLYLYQDEDRTIPVNLNGVVARAQLRSRCGNYVFNIPCEVFPQEGKVSYAVPASETETLTIGSKYIYDIELTYTDGTRQTVFANEVLIVSDYTE